MKIYAPVKDANGVWASVQFVNGVGETDNPKLIAWFRSHGYKVPLEDGECIKTETHPIETKVVAEEEPEMMGYAEKQPDFESMTPNQIREWMFANGYNPRNTRSKEKLLEIIRG